MENITARKKYIISFDESKIYFGYNADGTPYYIPTGEPVDLGLSVKWSSCNLGATKPSDYGGYFAYAETSMTRAMSSTGWNYTVETAPYYDAQTKNFSKYYSGQDDKDYMRLELTDDAAYVNWGSSWSIPAVRDFNELVNNCTFTWTSQDGVPGYLVTSNKEGYTDKSIFLPACGVRKGTKLEMDGESKTIYVNGDEHETITEHYNYCAFYRLNSNFYKARGCAFEFYDIDKDKPQNNYDSYGEDITMSSWGMSLRPIYK